MKRPEQSGGAAPLGTPEDWLRHAESDLALARLAKGRPDILSHLACFHAQQAAEKSLKAVLLARGVEFPLVHDLEVLLDLLVGAGLIVPKEVEGVGSLTPYAVDARYPGVAPLVSPSEVDDALDLAGRTLAWARTITHAGE